MQFSFNKVLDTDKMLRNMDGVKIQFSMSAQIEFNKIDFLSIEQSLSSNCDKHSIVKLMISMYYSSSWNSILWNSDSYVINNKAKSLFYKSNDTIYLSLLFVKWENKEKFFFAFDFILNCTLSLNESTKSCVNLIQKVYIWCFCWCCCWFINKVLSYQLSSMRMTNSSRDLLKESKSKRFIQVYNFKTKTTTRAASKYHFSDLFFHLLLNSSSFSNGSVSQKQEINVWKTFNGINID